MEDYEERHMELTRRYYEAVENFIETVKKDVNVIAVIVQGSLTNDVIWEKSDIDGTVIVRDQKLDVKNFCFDADGIVLNVSVTERSSFIRMLERGDGSYFSKAKVMYTIDDSITEMFERNKYIGEKDAERSALFSACEAVCLMEKCEKWLYVKKDYNYCRLYVLKAAEALSRVEICLNKEAPTREVLQRANILNPKLIERFYTYPMNTILGKEELGKLIEEMDGYLTSHLDSISGQILEFLSDGEIKTVKMIAREFHTNDHYIVHILEYFASKGLIDKVTQTVRLTPKSRPVLEEVAFMLIKN